MKWFSEKNNNITINVYVVPRSSKNEIVGIYNNCLKIKLKAPPQDNAANKELVKFLSQILETSKLNIEIIRGHSQRNKVLDLRGVQRESLDTIVSLHPKA